MSTVAARVRSAPSFSETDKLIDSLVNQKNRLIPYLGFLEGTLGNQNQNKMQNSYSGNALNPLINGSAQLVVLGICRIFDSKYPLLIAALESTKNVSDELESERRNAHSDWDEDWLQIGRLSQEVEKTRLRADKFYKSNLFARIRVFRTEDLAHAHVFPSYDRRKFSLGNEEFKISLDELISAAKECIDIVDSLISHWRFHIENSQQSLDIQKRYTECFWDALPNLSETENTAIVFK